MEQRFKFEENPYGYKSKEISAPKSCLIGVSGGSADQLLRKTRLSEIEITYKNKASLWSENLSKVVDTVSIQQLEEAWFFNKKQQAPTTHGFILQLGKFDENKFGGVFDTNFLYTVKIGNVERYMMIRVIKNEKHAIPDNIFAAVGKWVGSVDHKSLQKQHAYLADARWGSLKKFQSQKMDPLKTVDPLGNTIAHLSIHNQFLDVFMHIAKSYPTLLNAQNMFGNTPLHHLALLHLRCTSNLRYFDWELFWELPWNYSTKNKQGLTGVEKLREIKAEDLIAAFQALTSNEKAWNEVKKHHDIAKLLSSVVIKYISSNKLKTMDKDKLEIQDVKLVQYFLDKGASDKESIFNAALESSSHHLVDLLANHVRVSYESVSAAFSSQNRLMADVVLKRFDLNTMTKEQSNPLCTFAVQAGWADIVSTLAKKGCNLPLESIQFKTKLNVANIIARVNSSTILPLKMLCVDNIAASVKKEDFDKVSTTWPEEIKALFLDTDLWRWTLFLEDEAQRNRCLSLYSAISRAHRSENMEEMEICLGRVEIAVKGFFTRIYNNDDWVTPRKVGLQIWPGKLTETPPETKYEILDYTSGDPRKSMKPRVVCTEKHPETLNQILEWIGWPVDDDYIFLMICFSAFVSIKGESLDQRFSKQWVGSCFFPSAIDAHISPPKWYLNFMKEVYGIGPNRLVKKRKRVVKAQEFDSGSI